MSTSPVPIGAQTKSLLTLTNVSGLATILALGVAAFFGSNTSRVAILIGLVAGVICYFSKKA